ncbi:MAG: hypothetical protein R3D66_03330 [Alphaproteobacteria bacterium]
MRNTSDMASKSPENTVPLIDIGNDRTARVLLIEMTGRPGAWSPKACKTIAS